MTRPVGGSTPPSTANTLNPNTAWYPRPPVFPGWGFITSPPSVPLRPCRPKPLGSCLGISASTAAGIFFPGIAAILMALEAQLRQDIISLVVRPTGRCLTGITLAGTVAASTRCRPRLRRRLCQMAPPIPSMSPCATGPTEIERFLFPVRRRFPTVR